MIWRWRISFRVSVRSLTVAALIARWRTSFRVSVRSLTVAALIARWRISFRVSVRSLTVAALIAPVIALAGSVSGEVELTNSKDAAVRKHRDYSGVVIWLEPVDRAAPAAPPKRVEMLQKEKQFVPHVVAIALGGTVDFPNVGPIFHNAFSNFNRQSFDI